MTKTTRWKLPLLLCALIIGATVIISWFLPAKNTLELPEDLLNKAQTLRIDMHKPQNKDWQEKIIAAASGFRQQEVKDMQLSDLATAANANKNYEAAFSALIQIRTLPQREKLAQALFETAIKNCADLPWGVFALKTINSGDLQDSLSKVLIEQWNICKNKDAIQTN